MTEKEVDAKPNILITGTPGVGKSYLCSRLAKQLNLKWQDCSKLAKEHDLTDGYDEELDCPILDEDKLLDYLEPIIKEGGNIVEYHGCDFFPERFFNIVFVVTCPNTELYDRLTERGYSDKKRKKNLECEIFGALLEEARDSYSEVIELSGATKKDAQKSLKTIKEWYEQWKRK